MGTSCKYNKCKFLQTMVILFDKMQILKKKIFYIQIGYQKRKVYKKNFLLCLFFILQIKVLDGLKMLLSEASL